MQTIVVVLIVLAAVVFLGRRFLNIVSKKGSSTSGCVCDGCLSGTKNSCHEIENHPR